MAYKNAEDRRAYHRKYMQERREWYKSHRMCAECGKQDAYTLGGRYLCYECNSKHRIREGYEPTIDHLKFSSHPKNRKDYSKIPRNQFKERGLCYLCGKPALSGFGVCKKHYEHMKKMRAMQKESGADRMLREAINNRWILQKAKQKWSETANGRY